MLLRATHFPARLTHGFTTRHGGVSEGEYASLNMGAKWGDDPDAVRENYRRVAEAGGFHPDAFVQVRQVHGDAVARARRVAPGTEADAIWHHRDDGEGVVVAVLTADCVPVLIADEDATVVAAVHSGWRGTVQGVVTRAVETLVEAGVRAERLRAAIGPCIEIDAFEVGDEVAEQFEAHLVRREAGGRPHVDLVGAVREQLVGAGLDPGHVQRVGGCTHGEPDRFFSYRRDAYGASTKTGQHLSFIGFP
jgi:YfiH family protein